MTYSVIGILALLMLVIENQDIFFHKEETFELPAWKTYRQFLIAVAIYYVTDILWGLIEEQKLSLLLHLDTSLYFASVAAGALFWTRYTIAFLEEDDRFGRIFVWIGRVFAFLTWGAVLVNLFVPILFWVDEAGRYHTAGLRNVVLGAQIVLLLSLSCYALVSLIRHHDTQGKEHRYRILAFFGLIMGVCLLCQLLYVYLPFYSVAYMFGTSMLRASIIGREKEKYSLELKEANRITELKQSITSLLDNMPTLSFSKDAVTGVYLACNQAFAEYANRKSPEEVVGLTDFEIFEQSVAVHFVEDDQKAMSMEKPYVLYEDVTDAAGKPKQFQTTKLKFYDTNGRLCLLGMSLDVTEMQRAQRESEQARAAYKEAVSHGQVYENIVNALSEDYFNLYYVDLITDTFVEYGSVTEAGHLSVSREGTDFFASAKERAPRFIVEEDVPGFLATINKEKMQQVVREQGTVRYVYRLQIHGNPVYVSLKATCIEGDDRHIIIGIINVDRQVKDRMAADQAREERKAYNRLNALNGNLIVMYAVGLDGSYTQFGATEIFEELGIARQGTDFFADTCENSYYTVHPEDQELFRSVVTMENIQKAIARDGVFTLDYKMMVGKMPTFVRLKAAEVEEDGKRQFIIGLLDVDSQVRHEHEYADQLSAARKMANADALTGVKNKNAYVEWEATLDERIEAGEQEPFAIVVCDINDMKAVNDLYGHQEGDACIRRAAIRICKIFCHSPVFRVGGDEFAVMLFGEDYESREGLMEQMNRLPEDASQVKVGDIISAGMADFDPKEHKHVKNVFELADKAMYERKHLLKNKGE